MGYFAAIFLQVLWLTLIWSTICCELSLFVRIFILLSALAKDIVANIKGIEDKFINGNAEQLTNIEKNQMLEEIIKIVRFHVQAKEFCIPSIFHSSPSVSYCFTYILLIQFSFRQICFKIFRHLQNVPNDLLWIMDNCLLYLYVRHECGK